MAANCNSHAGLSMVVKAVVVDCCGSHVAVVARFLSPWSNILFFLFEF